MTVCRLCDDARRDLHRVFQDATHVHACAVLPGNWHALPHCTAARAPLDPGQCRGVVDTPHGPMMRLDPGPRFRATQTGVASMWVLVDKVNRRILTAYPTAPTCYATAPKRKRKAKAVSPAADYGGYAHYMLKGLNP